MTAAPTAAEQPLATYQPTTDEIVSAYRRHGLKPRRHLFICEQGADILACPLGALLFDKNRTVGEDPALISMESISEDLGIDTGFSEGVINGFDGGTGCECEACHEIQETQEEYDPLYVLGLTVGREVAQVMFEGAA